MTDINYITGIELGVKAVQDVTNMHVETGKKRISIGDLLQMCAERIDHWQEKYERLGTLCKTHETCNLSEFSKWMEVSRQTVYNWRENGYQILGGKGVDMRETYKFWCELRRFLRW